jgi:hypothetical protein
MLKKRLFGMMAVLAVVMLVFGFVGCDNGTTDNGGNSGDGVLVKIDNFTGTLGQISVHSTKPANVIDTNNNVLAAGGFYGSTTSGPLTSGSGSWQGGSGYIVLYAGADHYVSKIQHTLSSGTNTISFTNNFDLLTANGNGDNSLTLSNGPSSYIVLVTTTSLSNSSTFEAALAAADLLAQGEGEGNLFSLTWTGNNTGTYNVFIFSSIISAAKYQNNVSFSNGIPSTTLN